MNENMKLFVVRFWGVKITVTSNDFRRALLARGVSEKNSSLVLELLEKVISMVAR